MEVITYLIKILYHIFMLLALYFIGLYCEKQKAIYVISFGRNYQYRINSSGKLRFKAIVFFCLLEGIYSFVCGPKGLYIADRFLYAKKFSLNVFSKSSSLGLYYIQSILRALTDNPDVLFFCVAILYMLMTCMAYNLLENPSAKVWLFIGASQFLLFGCYQLKQALASAFVALSIMLFIENKKIPSIITAALSICFHAAAWIIIPIYMILYGEKAKTVKYIGYCLLFVSVFAFQFMSNYAINIAIRLIPSMSAQMELYTDSANEIILDNNFMTIFKGIPFYLISIEGIIYKKDLENTVNRYQTYLFLSLFVSVASFLSGFMYWMWRFAELVYFPIFVFAAEIYDKKKDRNTEILFWVIIVSLLLITIRKLFICYFTYGGIV